MKWTKTARAAICVALTATALGAPSTWAEEVTDPTPDQRINLLENRIKDLEDELARQKKTLLISDGKLVIEASGRSVEIGALNGDSFGLAIKTGSEFAAALAVESGSPTLLLRDNESQILSIVDKDSVYTGFKFEGKKVATIGRFENKTNSPGLLQFYNPGGERVAAIGVNKNDRGAVVVGLGQDSISGVFAAGEAGGEIGLFKNGSKTAAMLGSAVPPSVAIFDTATEPLAALVRSDTGGGEVATSDASGKGVFRAGSDVDGGSACVIRKGDQKRCLGIGLPGMP